MLLSVVLGVEIVWRIYECEVISWKPTVSPMLLTALNASIAAATTTMPSYFKGV
jgi:hypothetical protein